MKKIWMVEEKAPRSRTWRIMGVGPYISRDAAERAMAIFARHTSTTRRYRAVQYARVEKKP